ncbi:haloacid dehalogenase [Bifidobacterium asteroides DSM 20089]|uniref:Haloacid dehalogenase n=1 Tax=Bifidobacterium asteroides DSM 20089 TaxID=1437594 RepID=A0AAD0EVB4_9BIFI|nr:cation-translocating P-type ATPase [Bifidobacterium asteroides]AFU72152.1 transporter, probably Putative Ca2+ ATPase, Pmo1 [Bifidobacterium asteroides PRL2011]ATO41929.1 haloacid dehalogenase [Bifidobacterium asteroides DSM 20089]
MTGLTSDSKHEQSTDAGVILAAGQDSGQKSGVDDPVLKDPSTVDVDQVALALNVDPDQGLAEAEAAHRLEQFGRNELAGAPPVPAWRKFLQQFKDPLVYLLLAATAISLVAWVVERSHPATGGGEPLPFDAIVIMIILILNAALGYAQEAKAERAVDALASMTAPRASVLRDGQVVSMETSRIVPGDVVVLAEGDSVGADGRLFQAASLRVAEASLTGESLPVGKRPSRLDRPKALGDRTNMVFNGTAVTQGTGRMIVTSTGMDTQVGKIAGMLADTQEEPTPLQKEMARVSKLLGLAVCLIAVLVLAALALMEGFKTTQDLIDSLLMAVSLAVAAVPEGLTAILTVVLALGVQRMAKHHAIVKKLSSVETLGSASVICSDKTGTLTRNEMTVERVVVPSGQVRLTGTGYAPEGAMQPVEASGSDDQQLTDAIDSSLAEAVEETLMVGTIANDGDLHWQVDQAEPGSQVQSGSGQGHWQIVGDPTEVSLIVAARKVGSDAKADGYRRLAEIPFTSERKLMSVLAAPNDGGEGQSRLFCKGAPDVLLGRCDRILDGGQVRPMTSADRERILARVGSLSADAYRTLGQAFRPLSDQELSSLAEPDEGEEPSSTVGTDQTDRLSQRSQHAPAIRLSADKVIQESPQLESNLIWTGMVGIIDPPRTEVRHAVDQAHKAGIRTIMITGDHPLTAARIAGDLGIIKPGQPACTGEQLDAMDSDQLRETTSKVSVYARVAPEHKLKIVESLQDQGKVVAMTGDGVNDAPAVKTADIGVAMGITGTEVTKESAKMILADDNFATIVQAVREGRGIFDNIRKFLRYLLSSNMGEVFTVFGGVVFAGLLGISQPGMAGVTVPLLATQLLWINLLTDAAPALAMGVDPQTDDLMDRPPRSINDRVIDRDMWVDIIYIGLVMALVTLIGMDMHLSGGLFTDRSVQAIGHEAQIREARTMGFTILVFAQLFNALASRSSRKSAFQGLFSNPWLWGAIGISILLQLLVIYVPFLGEAFGTVPLQPQAWLECIALASLVLVASELRKLFNWAVRRVRA